jgi:transcriptional antiterminator RfaH
MSNFRQGWFVAYTKPRHEKKLAARLTQIGINTFLPVMKSIRIWKDRKKRIDMPLFPSYLFIYLTDIQSYYDGLKTDGCIYYLKTGTEIARVSDKIIDNIRMLIDNNVSLKVINEQFHPGQEIMIKQGALAGLNGEVVQVNGCKSLLIRVKLLQRNLLVTLPPESLATEMQLN